MAICLIPQRISAASRDAVSLERSVARRSSSLFVWLARTKSFPRQFDRLMANILATWAVVGLAGAMRLNRRSGPFVAASRRGPT